MRKSLLIWIIAAMVAAGLAFAYVWNGAVNEARKELQYLDDRVGSLERSISAGEVKTRVQAQAFCERISAAADELARTHKLAMALGSLQHDMADVTLRCTSLVRRVSAN